MNPDHANDTSKYMVFAGQNLGAMIRTLWGLKKNPSEQPSLSLDNIFGDIEDIIRWAINSFKTVTAAAIGEIEMKSGPVQMPETCMDDAMFNDTMNLLIIVQQYIHQIWDWSDVIRAIPAFVRYGYKVNDNCRIAEVTKYVQKYCMNNGGCAWYQVSTRALMHSIEITILYEEFQFYFGKGDTESISIAGQKFGKIIRTIYDINKKQFDLKGMISA